MSAVHGEVAPAFFDCKQLSTRLGIAQSTIHAQVARGDLPRPVKIGRCTRWPRTVIERFIADRMAAASGAA